MRFTRTEQVPHEVTYRVQCDACGQSRDNADPDGWHHFNSYHGDWGNDSVDSFKYHDVCSFVCYLEIVREEFEGYASGTPRNPTLHIDDKDWWFIRDMLGHAPATQEEDR